MSIATYFYILHQLPVELQQLIVLYSLPNFGILSYPSFLYRLINRFSLRFDLNLKQQGDKLIISSNSIPNLTPFILASESFYSYNKIFNILPIDNFTVQYFEFAGPWTNLIKLSKKLSIMLEGSLTVSPYRTYLNRATSIRIPVISLHIFTVLIDNIPNFKSLKSIEVVIQTDLWYIAELKHLAENVPLLIIEFNGPVRLLSEPNYVEKLINLPNSQLKLNTLATPLNFIPFDLVKNLPCRQLLLCEGADVKNVVNDYMPKITNLKTVTIQYFSVEHLTFISDSVREVVIYCPSTIIGCDFTKLTKLRIFTLALSLGCLINQNISFKLPDTVMELNLSVYLGKFEVNLYDLYKSISFPKCLECLTITSNLLKFVKLNECPNLQKLTIESSFGMVNKAGSEFIETLPRQGILSRTRSRTLTQFTSSSSSSLSSSSPSGLSSFSSTSSTSFESKSLEQLFIPNGVQDFGIELTLIFKRNVAVLLSASSIPVTFNIRKKLKKTFKNLDQIVSVNNLPSNTTIYRLREPVTLIIDNSEIKYFSRLNEGNLKFEKIDKRFASCAAIMKLNQ